MIRSVLLLILAATSPIVDHLVVSKAHHTLTLYSNGQPLHVYQVALGPATGPKQQRGDHRTPEGHYVIDHHNPHSSYHLSLHVSYPNAADRLQASRAHLPTGGDIMIHGLPPGAAALGPLQHMTDWTDGCVAVSNSEMDEIYRLVPDGTPIDILP